MLEQIFSTDRLDKITAKNVKKSQGESSGDSFESLLTQQETKSEKLDHKGILNNLASMFEDDKDFFKETFNFLNSSGELTDSESSDTELLSQSTKSSSSLVSETVSFGGLTFGGNLQASDLDDSKLKMLIHQAKEALKGELMKHSFSEGELQGKSLRDLSGLASKYGLSLKDVKFSSSGGSGSEQVSGTSNELLNSSKTSSSGSTQNLLSMRGGFELQTPAKLLQSVNSADSTEINMAKNTSKEVDLNSLLANTNVSKTETDKKAINLSSLLSATEIDESQLAEETIKAEKGFKLDTVANAKVSSSDILSKVEENQTNTKDTTLNAKKEEMINNVAKKLGMSSDLLKSVFSEQELKELNLELNPVNPSLNNLNTAVVENAVNSQNSEVIGIADVKSTDSTTTNKTDLQDKINFSKQTMKYLSDDVKQAIEDYRPPFQKLTINLNPKNLGELDVTLVQRGNNMHINLSGNATAINLLAMNSAELKNSLAEAGLNNSSMNFNNSENDGSQSRNSRQQELIDKMMEENNFEEDAEDFLTSLEIVTNYS